MKVVLCCTRNWYIYLSVVVYSILKNNKVDKIYLIIEDDDIPYIRNKEVEFININKIKDYVLESSPNYKTQYSKLSYVRCYFTKILKEDKIIYIDADAIIDGSIEELWNIDLEDNVIAGVKEGGEWDKHLNTTGLDGKYINSGILVMDLKKIREEGLDDSMIYLLNHNQYSYPDQDVINLVCRNRIKYLDTKYNSTETTGIVNNAVVIHYIRGRKGWIKESPRSETWYKYHNKMIEEENGMEKYVVRVLKRFNDYEGRETTGNDFKERKIGDEFECDRERYMYLKEHDAVELVEMIPEEKPVFKEIAKAEEIKLEYKEEKETTPKKKNVVKKK